MSLRAAAIAIGHSTETVHIAGYAGVLLNLYEGHERALRDGLSADWSDPRAQRRSRLTA
jgi:hypothetical protein